MTLSSKLTIVLTSIVAFYLFYFHSFLSKVVVGGSLGQTEAHKDTTLHGGVQHTAVLSTQRSQNDSNDIHIIFSTDCSPFQSWQSFAVFHSALSVSQPGLVTRIVSGCTPSDRSLMQSWHDTYITPMSRSFRVHFTPAFDHVEGESTKYAFFNKPYGTLHFLENEIGIGEDGKIKVRGRRRGEDTETWRVKDLTG